MAGFHLNLKAFRVPKDDEPISSCQDFFSFCEDTRSYAIADGVANSFMSGIWADLLTTHFCIDNKQLFKTKAWEKWLFPIQEQWIQEIKNQYKESSNYRILRRIENEDIAASTFIGLKFNREYRNKISWQTILIGDSVLFKVQSNKIISFQINDYNQFSNQTEFFASRLNNNYYSPKFIKGQATVGDRFILTTDAFAHWILKNIAFNNQILEKIYAINNIEHFIELVSQAKNDETIRLQDDDVAVMLIEISPNKKESIIGHHSQILLNDKEANSFDLNIPFFDL